MRMQQQPPGKLTVCAWDKHIFLMSIYIYTYIYIHNQQTKWSFSIAMLNHRKVSELKMGWTYQSGLAAAHQNG
jgi:hypothetical protein